MNRSPLVLVLVCLSFSCGAAPQNKAETGKKPPPIVLGKDPKGAPGPAEAEPPPPAVSARWAETTPAKPVIDGEIAEWGPLTIEGSEAPSQVAVGLTKTAAFFVASLEGASKDGIWIGLSAPFGDLPPLGYMQRDGQFLPLNCKAPGMEPGSAGAKECHAIEDRHAAFVAAHAKRFQRFYRLDGKAIRVLGKNGLEPIPNAVVASKATAKGQTIEVQLPLLALPRTGEPAVSTFSLYAAPGPEAAPPEAPKDAWTEVIAADSVAFEPYGELRGIAQMKAFPAGFSYQPGEPNKIEILALPETFERYVLEPRECILWEPLTNLGDVSVGYIRTTYVALGIYKAAKLVDDLYIEGEPQGFVIRNKAIHVFSFDKHVNDGDGILMGHWHVKVVDAAGKEGADPLESDDVYGWGDVEEFHSADFEKFGLRGLSRSGEDGEPPERIEITWKFDKKSGKYKPTTRTITGKK